MNFSILSLTFLACVASSLACECGYEGSAGRIYNGKAVRAHKYPWLAHIRSFENRKSGSYAQCGGSLIDESHIATAAHCVVDDNGDIMKAQNIDVYLGRVKAFTERSKGERVVKVWVDPKYNREDLSGDFAILTLAQPVPFTKTVSPVCLPNTEEGLSKLTVSGWGLTAPKASSSDQLLDVDVDYLTKNECEDIKLDYLLKVNNYPRSMKKRVRPPPIADTHMCAINSQTMGDACSGDSGGPLMYKGSNGRNYLMGVVSGSWTECGTDVESAGLYTRVCAYKDIIHSIAPNACWLDLE